MPRRDPGSAGPGIYPAPPWPATVPMYKTCIIVIAGLAALGLAMWALVGPDVEGIPTRVRPYGESAFLVFPKYRSNTYSLARQRGDRLVPYPSRAAHEKGLITNAVDIHLDSRGTLWVLDSGVVRTLGKPLRKSGPRVLALDADTGEIKQTVPLDGLVRGRAQFLEVEESKGGPSRLYVSDGPARCIAVWEVASGRGRRLLLPRAVSHPSDVLYLALVGPTSLYFTYYRSPDMYVVDTREVAKGRGLVRRVGSKPPGVVIIGREGKHILFRVSGTPGALYSWDTDSGLNRRTFLPRDVGCVGDPIHAVGDTGKIWVLETDLAGFLSGKQRVGHRIRAIHHNVTAPRSHRGVRPTDNAPALSTTPRPATTNKGTGSARSTTSCFPSEEPTTVGTSPPLPTTSKPQSTTTPSPTTSCVPTEAPSTDSTTTPLPTIPSTRTSQSTTTTSPTTSLFPTEEPTTERTSSSLPTKPSTSTSQSSTTTGQTTSCISTEDPTTLCTSTPLPIINSPTTLSATTENPTTMVPAAVNTTTASPTTPRSSILFIATVPPSNPVPTATEATLEATTTPQSTYTPAPNQPDIRLINAPPL